MKFKTGYTGNYYVYIKEEEDYLKKSHALNIFDIKTELKYILSKSIGNRDELVYTHNEASLLKDETYTDGANLYLKEELDNVNILLSVLKRNDIYPLVDEIIVNEPINYNFVQSQLQQGLLTNKQDTERLTDEILKDLIKVILIDYNKDKDYILNDLGVKIKHIKDEESNSNLYNTINTVYLEDEYLVSIEDYVYHIKDKLITDLDKINDVHLISGIMDLTSKIETKLISLVTDTDITNFSMEIEIKDNIMVLHKYKSYSSLRAKVIKYINT